MKSVIKTSEMLCQFSEQEDARIVSATLAMEDGESAVVEAIATIAKVLGTNPTWARYSMGRILFVETLEAQGKTEDAIKSKWKRVCKESGITIPQSDDPEAKKKAEQRAKARAVFEHATDSELKAEMANLLSNPTLKRIDEAKKLGKELDTRQKAKGNDAKAELLALRKDIKDLVGDTDDWELLASVRTLLIQGIVDYPA